MIFFVISPLVQKKTVLYLGTAFLHHHSDGMLIPSASSACATAGWMMISGLFAGMGISALQPHLASIFQVFEEVFPPGGKIQKKN